MKLTTPPQTPTFSDVGDDVSSSSVDRVVTLSGMK
jgi:hypothetical protein